MFAEQVETAVRQFQSDHGLTVDGVVDEQTWAALVPGDEQQQPFTIDWEQLPWLAALVQYEASEDGMRQFLVANGMSAELLTADLGGE